MLINGYDFDGTIYPGDSSVDFYLYCRNRYPRVKRDVFGALPLLFALIVRKKDLTREKERFYRYLSFVPDAAAEAERFWSGQIALIKAWYLEQKREDDLIISASPEFFLTPVCRALGVRLIASKVDPKTGRYDGKKLPRQGKSAASAGSVPGGRNPPLLFGQPRGYPVGEAGKGSVSGQRRRYFAVSAQTPQPQPASIEQLQLKTIKYYSIWRLFWYDAVMHGK